MTEVKLNGPEFALKLQLCLRPSLHLSLQRRLSAILQKSLPRVFAAAMLCAIFSILPLSPVQAATLEVNASDAVALVRTIDHIDGDRAGTRTISLEALGYENGIEIGALNAASRFSFNLPTHAIIGDEIYAYLQLNQTLAQDAVGEVLIIPASGPASGDATRATLAGRVRDQGVAVTLPVSASGATGFDFDYGANASCAVSETREPSFAINGASNFTYTLDQPAITSVTDAARTLGTHVTITLPGGNLSGEQFAAAFTLARALEAAGRSVSFNRLPGVGFKNEAVSLAQVNEAASQMLTGMNAVHLAAALNDGRDEATMAFTLLAASGASVHALALGDIVIAEVWELEALTAAFENTKGALSRQSAGLRRTLAGSNLDLEGLGDLTILRAGSRAVIALTDAASGNELANLINGSRGEANGSDNLPIETLSAQADIAAPGLRSEWNLPFSFDDLPAGTLPDSFDISLNPGLATEAAGQLLHVFLNDQLLRTFRLGGEGQARRFSVGLPSGLMSRRNDLRVLLQRDATRAACNDNETSTLAQLLPSSGISLTRGNITPNEFFELAPLFRGGVDVALKASDLGNPVAALNGLRALANGILASDATTWFHFVPDGMRFAPRGSFLLYGVEPVGLDNGPVRFDRGAVAVTDTNGAPLLSLADMPEASVVQIVSAMGQYGLWVSQPLSLAPSARDLDFDHGNLAIVDEQGVALWLNSNAPRGPLINYISQHRIADFFAANRLIVLIIVWSLLTMVLVRVFVGGRKAKKD